MPGRRDTPDHQGWPQAKGLRGTRLGAAKGALTEWAIRRTINPSGWYPSRYQRSVCGGERALQVDDLKLGLAGA
jgi:hypothetical protein